MDREGWMRGLAVAREPGSTHACFFHCKWASRCSRPMWMEDDHHKPKFTCSDSIGVCVCTCDQVSQTSVQRGVHSGMNGLCLGGGHIPEPGSPGASALSLAGPAHPHKRAAVSYSQKETLCLTPQNDWILLPKKPGVHPSLYS